MSLLKRQQPLFALIKKEFRQIFRNPEMLRIVFVVPIIQLFILSFATTTDLRNVRLTIYDEDRTLESRRLGESFFHNSAFVETSPAESAQDLSTWLADGETDVTVWIPRNYSADIASGKTVGVAITVDGQNSSSAGRAMGYAQSVIRLENLRILEQIRQLNPQMASREHQVQAVTRFFYNPTLESRFFMVPAIMVMLVTLITVVLVGMSVVREKEVGTLEQLLVTPLTPGQIVAGKIIPFAILAMIEFTIALMIALFIFKVPLLGSVFVLYLCAGVYMLTTMGGGLLASTVSRTQQQAMFTVWFFLIFFIMTSGFFYPIENMPKWIAGLTYINPLRYFMAIIRGVFLRGATLADVWPNLGPLLLMGVVVFTVAVKRFHKRLA